MQADILAVHAATPALLSASIATGRTMSTGKAIRLVSRQEEALEPQGWEPHPWRPGVYVRGEATASRRGVLIFHD